jgi:hypothetical protein
VDLENPYDFSVGDIVHTIKITKKDEVMIGSKENVFMTTDL